MKIKITTEIKAVIDNLGNKTAQQSGLKVYTALYLCHKRRNKQGYFDCPSKYLRAINSRYSKIRDELLNAGIIDYMKTLKVDPSDIFKSIPSKRYSTKYGYCMKYKFLVDISQGEEVEVDFASNKKRRWYEITTNSLIELGHSPKITRDSFGRRVHYPLLNSYKEELKNIGLSVIDAQTSQPRLLWLIMKEKGLFDINYNNIFENDIDFYDYLSKELELPDRESAKNAFMFWVNGEMGSKISTIKKLFPITTNFINGLKKLYYKDSASFLQREEARIWIDDLLNNIPADFALPVHDSLIVKNEDLEKVLSYCISMYPDMRFSSRAL